jgi:hypothetical protein
LVFIFFDPRPLPSTTPPLHRMIVLMIALRTM